MRDQLSIQYISRLLDSPALITDGDRDSVASLIRTYPYFVPLRYIAAAEHRVPHTFSPDMLAKARPYIGNWIKYCDFSDAASQATVILEPETTEYNDLVQTELPQPQAADTEAPPAVTEAAPAILFAAEPVDDSHMEDRAADEPQAQTKYELTPERTEPVVKVSDEFLQLIREEPPVIPEQMGIVPQPVFKAGNEQPFLGPNEGSDEHEIIEEALPAAEPVPVALHVVTPVVEQPAAAGTSDVAGEALISPIYTQDYFLQQGEKISEEIPVEIEDLKESPEADDVDKSLMVMMSFSEWLLHFKSTTRKHEEEKKDQRALKTMWQKEKLAAALQEENEEIPENVFEMAVNSIAKEDGLASESLAEIYIKQGKYDKAMDMYRKLSLRNPQKNAYFARKI